MLTENGEVILDNRNNNRKERYRDVEIITRTTKNFYERM